MDKNNGKNKRSHALMVLAIWVIVLAVLFGFVAIVNMFSKENSKESDNTNTTTEEKEEEPTEEDLNSLSYFDKFEHLMAEDYEFSYQIINTKDTIQFEGQKVGDLIIGYKMDQTGVIKYKIESQKVYQLFIDHEEEISNLYDNIDSPLLDLHYVVDLLKSVNDKDILITEEELITTYHYNLLQDEKELEITVTENENSIEKIEIEKNSEQYILKYKSL